jgi:hypothetical protein
VRPKVSWKKEGGVVSARIWGRRGGSRVFILFLQGLQLFQGVLGPGPQRQ